MKNRNAPFLFLLTIFNFNSFCFAENLIPTKVRVALFDQTIKELKRLDGDGLLPRKNRPESFDQTVSKLRIKLIKAQTNFEIGRVFRQLDSTYTNLHAHITLNPLLGPPSDREARMKLAVPVRPEIVNQGQKDFVYRVSNARKEMIDPAISKTEIPETDDEVIAINKKPMKEITRELFIFCKFPLLEQCASDFNDHLTKQKLSWDQTKPLIYTLKRTSKSGTKIWDFTVASEPANKVSVASSAPALTEKKSVEDLCHIEKGRYPDWKATYIGYNICAFESEKYPGTSLLKISSFRYVEATEAKGEIQTIDDETQLYFEKYWKKKAPITKTLIIDVIENGGGDEPIEWYKLLLDRPFQEQYVQFKKIREFDAPSLRNELFYHDRSKELWLDQLVFSGKYHALKEGQFMPHFPQFCLHYKKGEEKSCDQGQFEPIPHGFTGKIKVLTDPWCISSCAGFVWQLKNELKDRVSYYGQPDSGDTTYGRIYMDAYLDPKSKQGFRLEMTGRPGGARQKLPENALFRWQVSVTRSADKNGKVISGIPQKMDHWVPTRSNPAMPWQTEVFQEALKN